MPDIIFLDYPQILPIKNDKELSEISDDILKLVKFSEMEFEYTTTPTKAIGGVGHWKIIKEREI